MNPSTSYEIVKRCKDNYELIKAQNKESASSGFPITALVSAVLMSLVAVNENILKTANDYHSKFYEVEWPEVISEFLVTGPAKVKKFSANHLFADVLTELRNSAAHHNYSFIVLELEENQDIKGIMFDIKIDNKDTEIKLYTCDLEKLLDALVSFHEKYPSPISPAKG